MRAAGKILTGILLLAGIAACTEYTPKPRGYYRIELAPPVYKELSESIDSLSHRPYSFRFSQQASIDTVSLLTDKNDGLILNYPALGAQLYCSYFTITTNRLDTFRKESESLVIRHAKNINAVKEQTYENREQNVTGSLFMLDEESSSPFQFMITDGNRHLLRGAFYYNFIPNADSIAPVRDYLKLEVQEIIQSFHWKE